MIQIYHSCRNVRLNLKLFNKCNRSRQISLGKQTGCSENSNEKHVPEKKKPNDSKIDDLKKNSKKEYPEEPTTCCMSRCANCVWLDYAEKLSEYYKDGGEQAIKEINEKVTDENIKTFLLHELKMRNPKK